MKRILVVLALLAVSATAFAQAKVIFSTDSLHLVYFDPNPGDLRPEDAALAGQPVPVGGLLPSGVTLIADLYSGSASSALTLVKSTNFSNSLSLGKWTAALTDLPLGEPGGATAFFQVLIHESDFGGYFGSSPLFTGVPGVAVYFNLFQHTSPFFSTWPDGTFPLNQVSAGAEGAIMLTIPEPGAMALAGLGVAVMLVWRRRT